MCDACVIRVIGVIMCDDLCVMRVIGVMMCDDACEECDTCVIGV